MKYNNFKYWTFVELKDLVNNPTEDIVDGPFGSNLKSSEYRKSGIPVFKIQNIKFNKFIDNNICYISKEKANTLSRHSFRYGDVIITKLGNPLGLCCKVPKKYPYGIIVADLIRFRANFKIIDIDFLVYGINNSSVQSQFQAITKGTTRPRVNLTIVRNINFPLPPLPEQRAIVAKIEELFSELDNGITNLKSAKEKLEIYRQAVLKKAFEGAFLPNEKTNDPNIWKKVKVNSLCDVVRGGSPRPAGDARFYYGDIPFLKVADITHGKGKYVSSYSYSIKKAGLKKTRLVNANTLLISNSGATLGVPKICSFKTTFNDGIAAFLGLDENSLLYHYYFWESKTVELRNINQGAAQPNLNTNMLGSIDIPICPLEEQLQIVKEIESRLSVCDHLAATIEENLKKAEALRQSILKKAFEGTLLSDEELEKCRREPDWEPAEELLKRIKNEKQNNKKIKK